MPSEASGRLGLRRNAVYVDAVFANDQGAPDTQRRVACLFERSAGDIAWRHYEIATGQNESRQERQLVVRFITAVGNYDYLFDWVFRQNGTITVALGTSGIEQVKAGQESQPTEQLPGWS